MKKKVLVLFLIASLTLMMLTLVACNGDLRCPNGHTWVDEVIQEPTCTEPGISYGRCSVCGIRRMPQVEPLGHDYVLIEGTDYVPTCLEDGFEGEFVCSRGCGSVIEGAVITAHGHKDADENKVCDICGSGTCEHVWGDWLYNGDGTHTKVCELDPDHTETADCYGGEPDCYNGAYCDGCGAEYTDRGDHVWGDWFANEDGTHGRVCELDEDHYDEDDCQYVEVGRTPADCENAEQVTFECSVCGYQYIEEGEPALGHAYPENWTDNGDNHIKVCANGCGVDLTEDHNFVETNRVEATCVENGSITYECEDCHKTYDEEILSAGHTYPENWTDNDDHHIKVCANGCAVDLIEDHNFVEVGRVEATCLENGSITYECEDCHKTYDEEILSAGHAYPETWTDNGNNHIKVCANGCGVDLTEDHNFVKVGRVEATCVENGSITYECEDCHKTYDEEILSAGHTYPETWTDNGDNHIKVCAKGCGIDLTEDHNFVETNRVESNCEEEGFITYTCEDCGNTYNETIDPIGHAYPETWTDNGNGTHSRVCGNDPSHVETENCKDGVATCTDNGVCSVCGGEYILAPGHTDGEIVIENVTEGACEVGGTYDEVTYCTVCGIETSRVSKEKDAPGHTNAESVEENRVEATCETSGSYDLVVYCTVCGEELSRTPNTIDATGHAWGAWTYNNDNATHSRVCANDTTHIETADCKDGVARCTENGVCSVCNGAYIPAHGHTEGTAVEENRVEATCEVDGSYDLVVYCTVCNEELSRTPNTINAIDHDWNEYVDNGDGTHTVICANDSTHTKVENHSGMEEDCTCDNCGLVSHVTHDGNVFDCDICGGVAGYYLMDSVNTYPDLRPSAIPQDGDTLKDGDRILIGSSGIYYDFSLPNNLGTTVQFGANSEEFIDIDKYLLTVVKVDDGVYAFRTSFGKYLAMDSSKQLTYIDDINDYSSWTILSSCGGDDKYEAYSTTITNVATNEKIQRVSATGRTVSKVNDLVVVVFRNVNVEHNISYVENGDGTHSIECSLCGVLVADKECSGGNVTCTKQGTCAECGGLYGEPSHKYVQEVISATCEDLGYTINTCSVCEDTYISDITDPVGHSYPETWTDNGDNHIKVCKNGCGIDIVGEHNYELTTALADCLNPETTTYTCIDCGNTYHTESGKALGHDMQRYWLDPETGIVYHAEYCIRCGELSLGEPLANVPDGEMGYPVATEYELAAILGASSQKDMVVYLENDITVTEPIVIYQTPVLHLNGNDITATGVMEDGNGALFVADGTAGIIINLEGGDITIAPEVETEEAYLIKFVGDENDGLVIRGEEGKESVVSTTGNTLIDIEGVCFVYIDGKQDTQFVVEGENPETIIPGVQIEPFIVTEIGSGVFVNWDPSEFVSESSNTMHMHVEYDEETNSYTVFGSEATEKVVDPTCEVGGYTVSACTHCDEEYNKRNLTEAIGHTEGTAVEENRVEATCETDGSYDMVVYCTVCDTEISRTPHTIDATGHAYPEVWTDNGENHIKVCGNGCGENQTEDHTYGYTYDTVNHTAKCSVCGHTVGPDAHIFNDDGSCEVCGYQPFVFEVNADGTLTLVSAGKDYKGYMIDDAGNVIIPGSVNGKEVTIIGANAFSGSEASGTGSIVVPASVTTIEQGAFTGRGSLQSVTFEEGSELATIGVSAFSGCQALSNIELPEGLETIGNCAFFNCDALTKIDIPASVTSIGEQAFDNSGLKTVNLADNSHLEEIGYAAFKNCYYLTEVTIPASVTTIGNETFSGLKSLERVEFEEGTELKTISSQMFSGCTSLSDITIPSTVTVIGHNAFDGCSSLTSINIPAGVTQIYGNAFTGTGLTDVYFEDCSVESWDKIAIDVPNFILEEIEQEGRIHFAEHNCADATVIPPTCEDDGYTINTCSVCGDTFTSDVTAATGHAEGAAVEENRVEATCEEDGSYDLVVYCTVCETELSRTPNTIDAKGHVDSNNWIDNYNKGTCSNICEVCGKHSFETLEHTLGAEGCTRCGFCAVKLTLETDGEGNNYYAISGRGNEFYLILSDDGNVDLSSKYVPTEIDGIPVTTIGASIEVDSEEKKISPFRGVNDTKTVTIPSNITTLNDGAFFSSHGLTSINIPDSVKYIGDQAFSNCALLTKISFSSNGNLNTIGEYAFSQSGLTEICIPNTVTSIGLAAFISCPNLYKVTFEENTSLTMISQNMLWNCKGLESISIPEGITTINISAFNKCSNLNTIDIPASMTRIEQNAFYGCSALTVVNYNSCECNWNKIKIAINDVNNGNEMLLKAEIRCIGEVVTDAAVDATCEATGLTEGKHCSVCNTVIVAQTIIPATGHAWGAWTYNNDNATHSRVCANDESHVESNNHDYADPTYYPQGEYSVIRGEKCNVCGYVHHISDATYNRLNGVTTEAEMRLLLERGYNVELLNDIVVTSPIVIEVEKIDPSVLDENGNVKPQYVNCKVGNYTLSATDNVDSIFVTETRLNLTCGKATNTGKIVAENYIVTLTGTNAENAVQFTFAEFITKGNSIANVDGKTAYAPTVIFTSGTFVIEGDTPELVCYQKDTYTYRVIHILRGTYYNWNPNEADEVYYVIDHVADQLTDENGDVIENAWILEHIYDVVEYVVEPTCTESGSAKLKCACEYSEYLKGEDGNDYVFVVDALEHDYKYTYNEDGTHTGVCSRDDSHTITADCAYDETRVPADCENAEVITHACTYCGYSYDTEGEGAIGHEWGEWTYNEDGTHSRVCGNDPTHVETEDCVGGEATCTEVGYCSVCGGAYQPANGHTYPTTWSQEGSIDGVHYKDCEVCSVRVEEHEHVFDTEEVYYTKQYGIYTGYDKEEKLIDIHWGRHCESCGWVEIYKLERTADGDTYEVLNKATGEIETFNTRTEVGPKKTASNYVMYPVSDFDEMWRLLTYGYSVYLENDITVPENGTTKLVATDTIQGRKFISISASYFREFYNQLVIVDLDKYTLSGAAGNKERLFVTNTYMLFDGTKGGRVSVDGIFIDNTGGAIVEFRGGTYETKGKYLVDMGNSATQPWSSRVYVKEPTTTFIVADVEGAEVFTTTNQRPMPEEGDNSKYVAVLEGGIYYHWKPSSYNEKAGWKAIHVRHDELYDEKTDSYSIPKECTYNRERIWKEATCTTNGTGQYHCVCGATEGTKFAIPATGHKYEWTDNGDGTCTAVCQNDASHVISNQPHVITANGCSNCGYCQLIYELNAQGTGYILTGVGKDFAGGDVIIDAEIDGKRVTAIGSTDQATANTYAMFKNREDVTSVFIPNTIERVGRDSFSGCTNLTTVTFESGSVLKKIYNYSFKNTALNTISIPDSVTHINEGVFYNCTELESVIFGQDSELNVINNLAFYGCTSLQSISIPDTVDTINSGAFNNCTSLETVNFGTNSQLTTLGNMAFYYCTSLKSITIPSGVTQIGWYVEQETQKYRVFDHCESLESINIPSAITEIGDRTFASCHNLKSVTFEGENLTNIGYQAFYYCRSLVNFEMPNSVKTIGASAFCYVAVETLKLSDNLETIGDSAFEACENLETVYVSDKLQSVGNRAFYACGKTDGNSAISNIYYSGTGEQWSAVTIGASNSSLSNATFHFNYKE